MSPTRTRTRCWLVAVVTVCFLMVAGMVSPVTAQEPVEEPPDTTVSDGTDDRGDKAKGDADPGNGDGDPRDTPSDPGLLDDGAEPEPGEEANIPADPPGKSGDRGRPNDPKILGDGAEPKPGKEGDIPADPAPKEFEDGFDPYDLPGADRPVNGTIGVPGGNGSRPIKTLTPIEITDKNLAQLPAPAIKPLPETAAEVATSVRESRFEGTPFGLRVAQEDTATRRGTAKLATLPPGQAKKLSALGAAFTLDFNGFGGRSSSLPRNTPEVPGNGRGLDNNADKGQGRPDLGTDSGWAITVDVQQLPEGLTTEQLDRLSVFIHTDCDKELDCGTVEELPTHVDAETGELVAEIGVEVLKATGGPDRTDKIAAGVGPQGKSGMILQLPDVNGFAYQASSSIFYSVSTAASGQQNDYSATNLGSLATWQVGASTGHAETSYAVQVPPAVGPVPDVSFSYSSGSVDGMTPDKNNQGGILGLGWSSSTPVISRATRVCASSTNNSPGGTGIDANGWWQSNLCFAYENDETRGFTLSMNGVGGRLVPTGNAGLTHPTVTGATYQRFVTENMNDMRILLVTDTTLTAAESNGGTYGQWWEVTTSDGTLYVFGRDFIFKPVSSTTSPTVAPLALNRVVDTTRRTNSAQVAPVAKAGQYGCGGYLQLCDTVINWHLDQVIDPNGNMAMYQYNNEQNHYRQTAAQGTANWAAYDRAVFPNVVDYGWYYNTGSVLPDPAVAAQRFRVEYGYAPRSTNGTLTGTFPETPTDQLCGDNTNPAYPNQASCITNLTPAFFDYYHLTQIETFAGSSRVSADIVSFEFADPADTASSSKLWVTGIQHQGETSSIDTPPVLFTKTWLDNRVNHPGTMSAMSMPRIGTIQTELGGKVTFTYGQPHDRQPRSTGSTSHPCYTGANPTNDYIRTGCYWFLQNYSNTTSTAVIFFNKWVVTKVREDAGLNSHSDYTEQTYTYNKAPDWAYSEQWGFGATDINTGITNPAKRNCEYGYGCNYWSDYRGHAKVTVQDRLGNKTQSFFFTGMAQDRFGVNDTQPLETGSASDPAVHVAIPRVGQVDNDKIYRGVAMGTRTLLPSGAITALDDTEYSRIYVEPASGATWPGAARTNWMRNKTQVRDPLAGSYLKQSTVTTYFDALTRRIRVWDQGLTASTPSATMSTADDLTTCYAYPVVNAAELNKSWVLGIAWKTATKIGSSSCDGTPSGFPGSTSWISGSSMRFDGGGTGSTPTKGNVTDARTFQYQGLSYSSWPGTTFVHNTRGQVRTETERHTGATTTSQYNAAWADLEWVDGPQPGTGDRTEFDTDRKYGVQTKISTKNAASQGNTLLTTDLTYDQLGRLKTVKLPGASKPSYVFDYQIDGDPNDTSYTTTKALRSPGAGALEYVTAYQVMDGFGRTVQTQSKDPVTNTLVTSTQKYGSVGEVKLATNPTRVNSSAAGSLLSYSWLGTGWTDTTIDAAASRVTTKQRSGTGATVHATSWTQTRGLVTKTNDPKSRETITVTDIRGRTITSTTPDGTVTYGYNERGDTTTIDGVMPGTGDRITTSYGSNWHTQPQSMDDPDLGDISYTYHYSGQLKTQSDGNVTTTSPNGNTLAVIYNTAGQPVELRKDTATGPVVSSWTYDNTGRMTGTTNNNLNTAGVSQGVVTRSLGYDSRGRMNTNTWNIPGLAAQSITQTYREMGGIATIAYPNSETTSYTYDGLERQNTLDHAGNQLASTPAFNARGQITNFASGNTTTVGSAWAFTTLGYEDWSGRLESKLVTAGATKLADFTYDWDNVGNLKSILDETGGINQRQCFSYDSSYRLTKAFTTSVASCSTVSGTDNTGPVPYQVTYAYDDDGNIDTANGTGTVNGSYTYGAGNAGPHAVTSAGTNTYGYTKGGLMDTRTVGGDTQTLTYDIQNRLVGIDGPGTTGDLEALYDAEGNRVKRTIDGLATYYLGETYQTGDTSTGGGSTGGPTTDDFNRADTTTGYGPNWTLHTPYSGGTVTTGRITSNEAVIDASWTMAVHATDTGSDTHYAEAVVDVSTSSNWVGPAVRLNSTGSEGYAVLARGGVNELRIYKIGPGIQGVKAIGASGPVDGKTVRIEADGNLISIYMDGALETTWTDTGTAYLGASNRGVGVMGHNGVFDDFEATNPSGSGGTTTTTTGTFSDDFNRANTTTGYGADWSLHTPYSGGTVTTGRINSNQAVIDASWTMTVVDAATGDNEHYAQAVVDLDASNNWTGPAVRLNSTGNEGWAVLARGGVNELRLYRISNGLALKTAIGAGTAVDGATVKIEADATQVRVYLDGVLKITRNTTDFSDATHQHTGMMGHNGSFDDFETIGTTTTTTPPPPASTTMTQVHHRFNGQGVGSTIDGVFVLAVTDHLGSGSLSRQADGTTVTQSYTPFGALRAGGSNVLATDMTFTGQTDDPGTGLVDYNARHYDPQLGRFVMADTVLAGLNRYSYVNNNPLKFTDPSGHEPCRGTVERSGKCTTKNKVEARMGGGTGDEGSDSTSKDPAIWADYDVSPEEADEWFGSETTYGESYYPDIAAYSAGANAHGSDTGQYTSVGRRAGIHYQRDHDDSVEIDWHFWNPLPDQACVSGSAVHGSGVSGTICFNIFEKDFGTLDVSGGPAHGYDIGFNGSLGWKLLDGGDPALASNFTINTCGGGGVAVVGALCRDLEGNYYGYVGVGEEFGAAVESHGTTTIDPFGWPWR